MVIVWGDKRKEVSLSARREKVAANKCHANIVVSYLLVLVESILWSNTVSESDERKVVWVYFSVLP